MLCGCAWSGQIQVFRVLCCTALPHQRIVSPLRSSLWSISRPESSFQGVVVVDMRERNGLPQMSIHFLDTLSMRPPPVEMASEMKSHSWGTPKR